MKELHWFCERLDFKHIVDKITFLKGLTKNKVTDAVVQMGRLKM